MPPTRSLLSLFLLVVAASAGAQPAPYRHWHTLDTPHFRVHASEGLEREGRVAGAAAERAYALLARELVPPRGLIELVVSDDADYSNGSATPSPSNRIVVFATPPVEDAGLRLNEDWLGLVVTHELTHIFHLDRTRGVWAGLQRVFGRAPLLFPNGYSPSWITEGLAVYYESRLTDGGRLRSWEHRGYARAAALEHALPHLGDLSLSTPRFPGGTVAYGYGSLLMEYLAAAHGDSAIPRFVERQAGAWVPLLQERAAKRAFGETFERAFGAWRDSVSTSADQPATALDATRELTTHPFYAVSPRWLDDTTLVYVASDGRRSAAAYTITTSGMRTRLGRRNGLGANVPLPGGGLLFAQPDYVGTEEVRSDLWVERDGAQRRLTRGARLIQPDVRRDGRIVAVQLAAGRSSLVLVDTAGRVAMLREGGADETWSEPRWSPDGVAIVAVRRAHGGTFSIVVVNDGGVDRPLVTSERALSSPAWASAGGRVLFISEAAGAPDVYATDSAGRAVSRIGHTAAGLLAAEPSPGGQRMATVALHANGYHLGIAPLPGRGTPVSAMAVPARADAQPLAPGDYHGYGVLRTLAPRYWLPVLETGIADGTRVGALTSGHDAVGRHAYSAWLGLQTNGRFAAGALAYRYAGLRRPYVDVGLSQDWTNEGRVTDTLGASLGTLARRIQDVSVAASFVRPRYRTAGSVTAGLGLERRLFATDSAGLLARLDPAFARTYLYPRAFLGASWSSAQRPTRAISREDGVTLAVTARERYRTDDARGTLSGSVVGTAAGYRSLPLPGFAHHVLATRVAAGVADARATTAFEVGGTSGGSLDIVPGLAVGEGRRTFGVRGFPAASLFGTSAFAGSVEYRAPLLLGGRGTWRIPAFFDRSSVSAFADGGRVGCVSSPRVVGLCSPAPLVGRTIGSVGAELGVSVAVLQLDLPELVRLGVAVPVAGRELVDAYVARVPAASGYVSLGYSF